MLASSGIWGWNLPPKRVILEFAELPPKPTETLSALGAAMFRVTREIEFCYGHRLLNYAGKCRYLHGHNGIAIITIEGPNLDDRGMLVDFSDIKSAVSTWIDDNLDHRMLLHRDDPVVPTLQEMGEPLYLLDQNPTAENIARLIYEQSAKLKLPVPIVEVKLWETPKCFAAYRPD